LLKFDEIGYWSEVKLAIVKEYAGAYSTILNAQSSPRLHHVYIDGFSGPGVHVSKTTGELVAGSPLNALAVQPPFREYFLMDLDGDKVEHLRRLVGDRSDVNILAGDCNELLLKEVFPKVRYENYRRGLCLLDPYGLQLDWQVIRSAGEMKSLELFVNFPIMDINRNALWQDREGVAPEDAVRMTRFWGDDSWRQVAYRPSKQYGLFSEAAIEKVANPDVAEAFRKRLQDVAGFAVVPEPMPMRNGKNAVVYYLFFASPKPVASKIVTSIFEKFRNRRA
jgi:three-Cys-motif partner protein